MNKELKLNKKDKSKVKYLFLSLIYGIIYYIFIFGAGTLLKLDNKEIGFTMIVSGIFGIYLQWVNKKVEEEISK